MKLLFILILSVLCMNSFAGNEGPNGGDPIAFEFVSLGNVIVNELERSDYRTLLQELQIDLNELRDKVLSGSRVYSEDKVFLADGTEVGAINYVRRSRIVIGSDRWKSYNAIQKLNLVLHEYLSLMEIELNIYEVSLEFIDVFRSVKTKLIETRSDVLHYYSGQVVARPLFEHNQGCDDNSSFLDSAKRATRQRAINICEADTQRNCDFHTYNIRIVDTLGTNSWTLNCKVEAVARLR